MGKGKRLRRERREALARADAAPDFAQLGQALSAITDAKGLAALVRRRPNLFGQPMLALLEELKSDPVLRVATETLIALVRAAPDDAAAALERYQAAIERLEQRAAALAPAVEQLKDLIEAGQLDDAIAIGEPAFAEALEGGLGPLMAEFSAWLAEAYRRRNATEPEDDLERAVGHLDRAVALTPPGARRSSMQMNLAALVADRHQQDPAENAEAATRLLEEALDGLGPEETELRSQIETNLGYGLTRRQRGRRVENLRRAHALLVDSLAVRSLERNAEDWAYTKINLAAVEADLSVFGEGNLTEAKAHLQEVIDAADQVDAPRLIGQAHGSLGSIEAEAAAALARANDREVIGPGQPPPPGADELPVLDAARANLNDALELLDPVEDRDDVGRALNNLGRVAELHNDDDGAIAFYRRALEFLRPVVRPQLSLAARWTVR